jgi:NAD(P)-dependent dehydrogenase (short-subunit alcohol dehydrogenase family)
VDRTVLVTGAASGVGKASALALAAAGWRVHATDVDEAGLAALADRLPDGCTTSRMDVTDEAAVRAVVEDLEAAGAVECLVNAAGFAAPGPVEDVPPERLDRLFAVNVHGAITVSRAVLPGMRARGRGRIVHVTSVLGRVVPPGMGAYAASKHALEAAVDAFRRETARFGVEVVAVQPAWVATGFQARAREELADAAGRGAYRGVYRLLTDGGFLTGGRLAVPPARVARVVRRAVAADDPRSRYPVGAVARGLLATRYVPTPLADRVFRAVEWVADRTTDRRGE